MYLGVSVIDFSLFLRFFYLILEQFRYCGVFVLHFIAIMRNLYITPINKEMANITRYNSYRSNHSVGTSSIM